MNHIQLECPEGQVVTLPPDGIISDGIISDGIISDGIISDGIISDDGILLSGSEIISGAQMPIQMLQGSSLVVPLLLKTDQGQTFLISRQILGEDVEDGETHYILTSGMETEEGEDADGVMTNIDMSNIDYSLVDHSNLVLSDGTTITVPQEIDANSAPNLSIDVSQLNLVQDTNVMHFATNADDSLVNTPQESLLARPGVSLLKPPDPGKDRGTSKEQLKRGRGRPKKEDADDIMEPPIGKGPYKCDQCGVEFDQWAQMKRHKRVHLNERPFRCKECYASFNIESNLKLHKATHNLDNLQCPECHRRFTRVASLRSHLMLHEVEDNLICSECGEEFNLLTHLHSHMQKHEDEWVNKNVEKIYDCPQCKYHFTRASALKEHMKEHLRVKSSLQHRKHKRHFDRSDFMHKCDTCQKQFQKPSQLLRHSRIHTGEKPFECKTCHRAFNQKGSLQVHMAKHSGAKPYVCDFCGACFSQKGNRRAHIERVHTIPQSDAVSYKCSECSCVFRKLGSLNSHMGRTHSRTDDSVREDRRQVNVDRLVDDMVALEKAVKCGSAGLDNRDILQQAINKSGLEGKPDGNAGAKKSENKDNPVTGFITLADKAMDGTVRRYTIRQRKVGGVRWHQCSFCNKEFKKPSDLVRHIRTHTHEKPFKCQHCFRAFSVKSTLTAHQRTHQAVQKVTCAVCLKQFSSSSSLKVHMRLHTGEMYPCRTCMTSFRSAALRQEHWATACNGGGQLGEKKKNGSLEKMKRKKINSTVDSSLPEIILQEPIVITDSGWSQHMPKVKMVSDPLDRPYGCDRCGAAFRKSSHLNMHLRVHSGERPFKCPVCNRSYISGTVLKAHMKTHDLLKAFNCEVCLNTFTTSGSLKRHMLTHSDTSLYMCPYCKKRFKNVSNCKKHMKIHKPEIAMQVAKHLGDTQIAGQRVLVSAVEDDGDFVGTSDFISLAENDIETVEATERVAQSLAEDAGNIIGDAILEGPTITISDTRSLARESISELSEKLEVAEVAVRNRSLLVSSPPPLALITDPPSMTLSLPTGSKPDAITSLAVINTQLPVDIDGKENGDLSSVIFGQAFQHQSFDGVTFSTITIQSDQLDEAILPHEVTADELSQDELATVVEPQNPAEAQETVSDLQKCNFCDEMFHRMSELRSHMITHKKFPCTQCERILSTASALKLHTKAHGKVKTFVCEQCHASFSSNQALVKHGVIHSDDSKVFTCERCAEQVASLSQLKQHLKMHDREGAVVSPKRKGSQIQLSDEVTLELATRDKESTMSVSEQVLIASAAERNRISEIKDTGKVVDDGPVHPNRCKFCPKSFRKPSDLTRHIRIHTGERPFRCDHCERTFTVKSTLDSHYRTHLRGQAKQFPCHVCNLRFATKGSLKVHMRIHTGAKPFKCPVCGQQFRTSGHRKAHMEMHERSANGLKVRSRKPRSQRVTNSEMNHVEQQRADAEEISAIESVQQDNSLVELAPDENVVSIVLQEIENSGNNDFQWQIADLDGVPLDPGTLTQDFLQQLQELLENKRKVVQSNGTAELISMEEDEQTETLAAADDENIIVTDDAMGEAEEVALHPIKDQEAFSMIQIANSDEQTAQGAEMIGMPFEIHTDEHGQDVNLQQALDNDEVIFSDIDIDMDTDSKMNLSVVPQGERFHLVRNTKFTTESVDPLALKDSAVKTLPNPKKRAKSSKNGKSNVYQCPDTQCSKIFSKPSQLQRHFRIHTGERPFQCDYCPKSFNQKNALTIHVKNHNGEKPWSCPHCSHRFSQRGNLKTHLKRAHSMALDKTQEDSMSQVPQSSTKKTKSPKVTKVTLLDDDDMVKLGLSFFNR